MSQTHRFGRRMSVPSTAQIKYELRVFSAHEEARTRRAAESAENLGPVGAGSSVGATSLDTIENK